MTWVIGRAGPFGHAVGVSDIRITLSDGTEHDCLQKMYKIGSQLVVGFAGSVAIGLEAVAQMSVGLNVPETDGIWDPLFIAETLPIGTRKLFELYPYHEKELGCELMLLSAHPLENDGPAPWARCYVHRYYSPEFEPVPAPPGEIVSIGLGSTIEPYVDGLKSLSEDMEMFKMEVGFQGGSGIALMSSLSTLLSNNPQKGISRHLHLSLVGRESVRLGNNGSMPHDNHGDPVPMPPVAQNLEELTELLSTKGISTVVGARC